MALLGDVFLDTVYKESPQQNNQTTDHPVEDGGNISDHVERKPMTMSLSGVVVGPDASMRLYKLRQYADNGELLTYDYRNGLGGCIIESFGTDHGVEVANGFMFQMTLKRMRVARPAVIEGLDYPVIVHVKTKDSKGRQQPKKAKEAAAPVKTTINPKYALNGK